MKKIFMENREKLVLVVVMLTEVSYNTITKRVLLNCLSVVRL